MPAQPIKFFRKNFCDFSYSGMTVTPSDSGPDTNPGTADSGSTAALVLDRSNLSGWGTTGSEDSYDTQLVVYFGGDSGTIDTVLLVNHNFASILLEYWTGSAWATFNTVAGITANTTAVAYEGGGSVTTTQMRLTIYGTQVANSDKFLSQFIATSTIGQLAGWPVITKPTLAKNVTAQPMLSGKTLLIQNIGMYSTSLAVDCWSDPTGADMTIVESLYDSAEGFLFWPCGGDQTQFRTIRQGYRLQDIFLCRCVNEFMPEWYQGFYQSGMKIQIDLAEVVD